MSPLTAQTIYQHIMHPSWVSSSLELQLTLLHTAAFGAVHILQMVLFGMQCVPGSADMPETSVTMLCCCQVVTVPAKVLQQDDMAKVTGHTTDLLELLGGWNKVIHIIVLHCYCFHYSALAVEAQPASKCGMAPAG